MRYQIDMEALVLDYAIIPDEDNQDGMGVHALQEHRRLTRSIERVLPTLEGRVICARYAQLNATE